MSSNQCHGSRSDRIRIFLPRQIRARIRNSYKGLVAVCHSFCIDFSLYNRYIHTSFIHKHSLRPISITSQLSAQWAEPPWGAEPRFVLGPAFQQASVLPTATLRHNYNGSGSGSASSQPSLSSLYHPANHSQLFVKHH